MTIPARLTPYAFQEASIERILTEPTRAALIGSEVGKGKTLLATEVALRAGWKRVLLIGVVHTFGQWQDHFQGQSEGAVTIRKMDNTSKAGRQAHADFLAGAEGIFFAGIQFLQAQDWAYEPAKDAEGRAIWKMDKKTGLPQLKPRPEAQWSVAHCVIERAEGEIGPAEGPMGRVEIAVKADMIGPAETPIRESMRTHLKTYAKMSARKGGGVDAIIFDEAHAVSNRTSIGRRTLLTFKAEGGTEPWKIGLSATWAANSFENAWSLPRWCWPDLIPAYWVWHETWCATETQYIAGGRAVQVVVGEKAPEGSFVKSLPCYVRDEADERPPAPIRIYCDSTPEQRAQYDDLVAELLTWAKNWEGDREPLVVDIPAVLDSRLKQVALAELSFDAEGKVNFAPDAASAKMVPLRNLLDGWGAQPVLIFVAGSKKYAKLVSNRMNAAGYRNEVWTGDVSQKERARIKQDFLDGRLQYIIGTPEAMGTGTDGLQRVCSKMVWLASPDGNPSLEEQGVGRLFRPHRTMQYGEFQDVRILMRDSIDTDKLDRLIARGRALRASIGAAALAN